MFNSQTDKITALKAQAQNICRKYNNKINFENKYDYSLLSSLFKNLGDNPYIESNFYCELGTNISFGNNSFLNHDATIVDYAPVKIGNNVNIAPKVGIYTTIYLDDPKLRKQHYLSAAPIIIEDSVWIGGHAVISAGVTVGKNSIIGAGSVVTEDIPANSVAVGNPARVIRKINIEDKPEKNSRYVFTSREFFLFI